MSSLSFLYVLIVCSVVIGAISYYVGWEKGFGFCSDIDNKALERAFNEGYKVGLERKLRGEPNAKI